MSTALVVAADIALHALLTHGIGGQAPLQVLIHPPHARPNDMILIVDGTLTTGLATTKIMSFGRSAVNSPYRKAPSLQSRLISVDSFYEPYETTVLEDAFPVEIANHFL